MNFFKKFIFIALISALSINAPIFVYASKESTEPKEVNKLDRVITIVNDDIISESEVTNRLKSWLKQVKHLQPEAQLPPYNEIFKTILEKFIDEKLQIQLAKKTGITVDDITLQKNLESYASSLNLTMPELQQEIAKSGARFEDIRDSMRTQLILRQIQDRDVAQNITISKGEIENFIKSPAGQEQIQMEYKIEHILVPSNDKQFAESVINKLNNNQPLESIKKSKSLNNQPIRVKTLDWRPVKGIPTMFVSLITSMKVNEYQGPIQGSGGYHIIKLLGKRVHNDDSNTEIRVRQILLRKENNNNDKIAEKKLLNIKQKLENDKTITFASLAKQYSEDPHSVKNGGDLGWLCEDAVLPEFYSQMSNLQKGQISQPFKTALGWHLIQVTELRNADTNNMDAVANKARQIIFQEKFQAKLDAWISRLREEAKIEYLETL